MKLVSHPEERDEYSRGYFHYKIRSAALGLLSDKNGRVIEVGCGEGIFINKLAKSNENFSIVGLDGWHEIIKRAQKRMQVNNILNVSLINADALRLPFKNGSFDNVVCINVIINLPSEEIFLSSLGEISRVCKKGGAFIFEIRNSLNPFLYFKYKFAKYYDPTVINLPLKTYKLKKVIAFLEKNNFKLEKRINIGFPDNNLSPVILLEARKI